MKIPSARPRRLSRRLIKIFVALMAVPIIVTVPLLQRIGQDQILQSTQAMRSIHAMSLDGASEEFHKLGRDAAHRSTELSTRISDAAVGSMVRRLRSSQSATLETAAGDLSDLTKESLGEAVARSVETNREAVSRITGQTRTLLDKSARDMQANSGSQLEKTMLEMIGHRLEERGARIATEVEKHVSDHLNYLSLTARMPDMSRGAPEAQKAVLDALVRRFPMFTEVALLDASGQEKALSSSDIVVTPADMQNRATEVYFQSAMSGETHVQLIDQEPVSRPALRLAVPVEIYRGKVTGVLAASLSLEDLFDSIRSTRIGERGYVYVLDSVGAPLVTPPSRSEERVTREAEVISLGWKIVVVQPRSEAVLPIKRLQAAIEANAQSNVNMIREQMTEAARTTARALASRTETIRAESASRTRARVEEIFSRLRTDTDSKSQAGLKNMRTAIQKESATIEKQIDRGMETAAHTSRLRLSARVDPMEAEAVRLANRRLTQCSLVILIVCCIAGCVIALVVAGRIVRPVVDLVEGTRAVAEGDLDRRIDESGPDEIGDLASAFNSMAESLKRSRAELNSAEAQLVQSAKLASLGTLSAGVAHELNQPVAIVRGLAQQLSDEPDIPDYVRDDLATIEKQTSRMIKIIKHLRTFCRMGMNEHSEVDVNQLVRDCFILIDAQLAAHNIEVELDLSDDNPIVLADGNEIEQVLLNLITNARDALEGRDGAKISIRTSVETGSVVIRFRDNGSGIPDAVLERIFDPFFTTKEPGKGTGLGLSISHSIITKHHGTIAVENAQGAAFTISLPVHDGAAQETSLSAKRAA